MFLSGRLCSCFSADSTSEMQCNAGTLVLPVVVELLPALSQFGLW